MCQAFRDTPVSSRVNTEMRFSPTFSIMLLVAFCAFPRPMNAQKPVGEVFASDASVKGSVVLTGSGTGVLSGSSVAAGESAASLRLTRGGQLRICPRTSVSVTSSSNGRDLMFGMSSGALETEYALAASADAIVTPDFRILLPGPGNFHFAVAADGHGDTCMRALPNNTGSLIVSELMGDGTYQVRPNEEVLFRGGKVADHVGNAGACGCPAPAPVLRAEAPKPGLASPAAANPAYPPPAPAPDSVHIQVEAPFVFRAGDPAPEFELTHPPARLQPLKAPVLDATILAPPQTAPAPQAVAAAAPPPKPKKPFLRRVGSFFASLFRKQVSGPP